ncbi:unnamed protein product [Closterium sp. Naga37s-1]|nr:unnamed protein product [Closterium sp. Naga37s-1]
MASESVHRDTGMIELDLPLPDVITATDAAGTSAISTLAAGPGSVKPVSTAEAAAAAAGMFLANTPGVVTACGVHVCACSDYKEAIYDLANASWRQLGDVCVMNNPSNSIPARSHALLEKRTDDSEVLLSGKTAAQVNQEHLPQQQQQQEEEQAQEEFSFFQFPVVPQRTMSLPLVDPAEEVRCAAMREQGYCLFARGGGVCSPGGLGGFSVPVQ